MANITVNIFDFDLDPYLTDLYPTRDLLRLYSNLAQKKRTLSSIASENFDDA